MGLVPFSVTTGALVLGAGLVVAVPAAAQSGSNRSSGWEPAVSAALAEAGTVLDRLDGSRATIGIRVRDLEQSEAAGDESAGAVVADVQDDGPAARAGLLAGDVIVAFDGERVRSARQLARLVGETVAGRSVPVEIVRDDQRTTIQIETEQRPWTGRRLMEGFGAAGPWLGDRVESFLPEMRVRLWPGARLGIVVQPVDGQLADYFGVDAGLLVTGVTEGSPAEAAGLQAGDVITAVDGEPVAGLSALAARLRGAAPGDRVGIDVTRDRTARSFEVELRADDSAGRRVAGRPF